MVGDESFRGWRRPGPLPPGGVGAEEAETLEYISGHFKIFQYERGHRYSTDDVLTAWYGTTCAPRVERALDLGSGIGSIAMIAAWRLPGARFVTVEAQEQSIRLARKSVRYNGLESRFTLYHGDLRDRELLAREAPFDLVFGSPPYWPPGTAVEAEHSQAVAARFETRGNLADYADAAVQALAPGGVFAFVAPLNASIGHGPLVMLRRR
ncbi:MAG TPA: methyltransferase, partial [Thermoanaerobaculia bacterium]|nr:methyltransferase [Thermoanaerobaculia bacterium]